MVAPDWLKVRLYTCSETTTGFIYHPHKDRLLDILSSMSVRHLENRGRFLELREAIIQTTDGKEESLQDVYINKESIHLVTTFDADSARGLGAEACFRIYPYTEKVAVPVTLSTSAYTVNGNVYRATYHHVWQALEDTSTFLPLTEVNIYSLVNKASWKAPFAAVNKGLIVSLKKRAE